MENKNSKNILKAVIFLQRRFRLKRKIVKNLNYELDFKYNLLYGVMRRIYESFRNSIITQHKYNTHLNKLDSILTKFKSIPRPLKIRHFIDIRLYQIRDILDYINKQLKNLCLECGASNIYDVIQIGLDDNLIINSDNTITKLIDFYNKVFIPISYNIYEHCFDSKNISNSTLLTIYDNDDITNKNYDMMYLPKINKIPVCRPINKKVSSIQEKINGTRLYIPISYSKNKKMEKKVIVMDGYFRDDPLNISRIGGIIGEKNINLVSLLTSLKINNNFKEGFIEQLSLRDFLTYDNSEIIEKCHNSYIEVMKLKDQTISSLVKDFLLSSIEKQRQILTLFLLMKDDVETQYLAHLMYDMISNESYLLKPQPLAEQVYNSLHWSVQKLFKVAIKRVEDYTKKLLKFDKDDIPYEKRICLLKAPDYVKAKAMEKYKEIVNKGNDNSAKCQQYLDGLLRIPFGNYKKESIISFLDKFKQKVKMFITEILSLISLDSKELYFIDKKIISNILELCINNQDANLTSDQINNFLDEFNNSINKITEYEDIELDNININNIVHNFDKKNKILDYKKVIKNINLNLEKNNLKTINEKGKKKELKERLTETIQNIDCIYTKKKYLRYLQNQDRNIEEDYITSPKYEILVNKISILSNEWKTYKKNSKEYISNVENILDKAVYGQSQAKKEIQRIIAQWINGEMKGYCFGFEGPPGTGKTSLAKKGISKCLMDDNESRPFSFIALGGSSNGSTLEGHSYTYVGSTWGKVADILIETQCMNPIIFIDELDKVSKTENGREIIGILTHLTDSSQNEEFCDKYFSGIKLDLSKALFIFSYNDFSLIDPILADRIHRVKFNHLTKNDKIHIINNYVKPELLETVGFSKNSITFDDDVIEYIINNYTFEAGIRKLKEKVFEIIREVNLRYITEDSSSNEIKIDIDMVKNIFSNKPKMLFKKIANKPHIGLVNGLYATSCGIGGLTIIETFKTPCDSKLSLILTGQQGDVMQESVKCAKTIAWNLIPNDIKAKIKAEWDEIGPYGIHVHCPEAATPKDGPSAGTAITIAIISLLCNIPVRNTIALTGEIDLNGTVHQIGGLDFKIEGGKFAGVKTILCPKQNKQDLEIYKKNKPEVVENINIITVSNIWEVLEMCLVENDIKFNKYVEN
jgi:endopeptidase La